MITNRHASPLEGAAWGRFARPGAARRPRAHPRQARCPHVGPPSTAPPSCRKKRDADSYRAHASHSSRGGGAPRGSRRDAPRAGAGVRLHPARRRRRTSRSGRSSTPIRDGRADVGVDVEARRRDAGVAVLQRQLPDQAGQVDPAGHRARPERGADVHAGLVARAGVRGALAPALGPGQGPLPHARPALDGDGARHLLADQGHLHHHDNRRPRGRRHGPRLREEQGREGQGRQALRRPRGGRGRDPQQARPDRLRQGVHTPRP